MRVKHTPRISAFAYSNLNGTAGSDGCGIWLHNILLVPDAATGALIFIAPQGEEACQ